jgi:hypothetical protein
MLKVRLVHLMMHLQLAPGLSVCALFAWLTQLSPKEDDPLRQVLDPNEQLLRNFQIELASIKVG